MDRKARSLAVRFAALGAAVLAALLALSACGGDDSLVIYSSRTSGLVKPLLEEFYKDTGIRIKVRYASTAELTATLLEEGKNTDVDVVYFAEAAGFGALAEAGMLGPLPDDVLSKVDSHFRSTKAQWVGTSGRVKTVVYNVDRIDPKRDLPASIMDFTDPKWKGRIGWAPSHGEWQMLVTSIRKTKGEEAARRWLEGMKANDPKPYPNLISIVQGVARGEVQVGFVNHYYVPRLISQQGQGFAARNHYVGNGDPGALVDVAAAGIINRSNKQKEAARFVQYLLEARAQRYFADQTFEYPLSAGVQPSGELPPLSSLQPPNIDQSDLADLRGTLDLLRSTGVLP